MGGVLLRGGSEANIALIIQLAQKLKIDAAPLSARQIEQLEDANLVRMVLEAREEGFADTDEVMRKLSR